MPAETPMMLTMFARQLAAAANASHSADVAVAIWNDVGTALSPIIGHAGVAALFKRSVHLTRSTHPCLSAVLDDEAHPGELATLRVVLAKQTQPAAAAANIALLQNFQDLLISLIGLSLTERLLRPVWDLPSSGQAEQDTTS